MLEIRPNCEHCGKELPNTSAEAMICSFECTYCEYCAHNLFKNVCPSCGGNFEKRPIRPSAMLAKHPVSKKRFHEPKDLEATQELIAKYGNISPGRR